MNRRVRAALLLLLAALVLGVACADEPPAEDGSRASTGTESAAGGSATPRATSTRTPAGGRPPTPTPTPAPPPLTQPAGVWLIELNPDRVHVLLEAPDASAPDVRWQADARFGPDGSVWVAGDRHVDRQGRPLEVTPGAVAPDIPVARIPEGFKSWVDGPRMATSGRLYPAQLDALFTVVTRTSDSEIVGRWLGRARLDGIASFEGKAAGLTDAARCTNRETQGFCMSWAHSGTNVNHPLLAGTLLLERAYAPVWSSDAAQVAYARADFAGEPGIVTTPERLPQPWVIEVFDLRARTRRELARIAHSENPPVIRWNPDATAIVLNFPQSGTSVPLVSFLPDPTTPPSPQVPFNTFSLPPERWGAWLIDVESADVHVLVEAPNGKHPTLKYPPDPKFAPDGSVWVYPLHFGAHGEVLPVPPEVAELGITAIPAADRLAEWQFLGVCRQPDQRVPRSFIFGLEYPVHCGRLSPDGRVMLMYPRSVDSARITAPVLLLDIGTGVSTELPVLSTYPCNCDFTWSGGWSPSGRFALLKGSADSKVHIYDRERGDVRLIASDRVFNWDASVTWSPTEDALLAPTVAGVPFVEWPATGRRVEFAGGKWPARFDRSGQFVVWHNPGRTNAGDAAIAVVARAATGEVLAQWRGNTQLDAGINGNFGQGIASFQGSPVGLTTTFRCLKRVYDRECERWIETGTTVHHPLLAGPLLLEGAEVPVWAPDGARVAYARQDLDPLERDGSWVIEVFDVRTGVRSELLRIPYTGQPVIRWNPAGTTLGVGAPALRGI